jgi:hypothetical protein
MVAQSTQKVTMGEPDQAQPFQGDQHRSSSSHSPFIVGQGFHEPSIVNRAITNAVGPHIPGGLNLPMQRPGPKYRNIKANPNLDVPGFRPPFNGQSAMIPAGGMIGGMPHANHYSQPQLAGHEMNPFVAPVPPSVYYPGFVGGTPIAPGAFPGYSWPFPLGNGDMLALNGPRHGSWPSAEDKNHSGDVGTPNNFHPSAGSIPLTGYPMTIPPFQVPQPCLQYQVMKTPSGYAIQDLESLTQQDPPIPRAVPAMWTNSSDLTLAKCLENREGITNVYIRGFLPETTDDILHGYASRFGQIERCKAIVDLETGLCKGLVSPVNFSFSLTHTDVAL